MGMLLALGGGLALYQMTSLMLGPGASRQLSISLNIPAVDVEDLSPPVASVNLVLGMLASPSAPAVASQTSSRTAGTRRGAGPAHPAAATLPASTPIPPIAVPTPSPVPSPTNPTVHPSPRPTPPIQRVPGRTDD
jgi:hypothetical protein